MEAKMNYWNKETIKDFLGLLKASLLIKDRYEEAVSVINGIDFSNINWDEVYSAANINGTIPLLYPVIEYIRDNSDVIADDLADKWKTGTKVNMIIELPKYTAIRRIIEKASQADIKIVFFKGLILSDLYPSYLYRSSCDSDIFVDKKDIRAFENILEELGYVKKQSSSKEEVQVYKHPSMRHVVEAHTCLWEDYKGPRMDILDRLSLTDKSTMVDLTACGIEVTTLGYEEHLIYQMFHIIKHFSLNGIGIKYLIDITLYVNKYLEFIDINRFWHKIDSLGYAKFAEYFFYVCHEYLGMTDEIYVQRNPEIGENVLGFIIDLINLGNVNEREAGWQILGAMEAYFTGEEKVSGTRFRRKIQMIFPSVKAMPKVYGYVKKYPILLPVAWIHRYIKFINKKISQKDNVYGMTEKINVAEKRLYLIKHLGLAEAINDECRDDD